MPQQNLLDLLRRSGGLAAIANHLKAEHPAVLAAADVLLPRVQDAFRGRVVQGGNPAIGMGRLLTHLADLGGGMLASAVLQQNLPQRAEIDRIAGDLLGPQDTPAQGIARAAQRSGLPVDTVRQVLPLLAMLTAGYLSARASLLSPADRLAELTPLLDPPGPDATIALDALPGMPDQPEP